MASEYISIEKAAEAVKRSPAFVRSLAKTGQVRALMAGGNAAHPRLRVRVSDVEAAMVYQPKVAVARKTPTRFNRPLHPAAAAMLQ